MFVRDRSAEPPSPNSRYADFEIHAASSRFCRRADVTALAHRNLAWKSEKWPGWRSGPQTGTLAARLLNINNPDIQIVIAAYISDENVGERNEKEKKGKDCHVGVCGDILLFASQ